MGERCHRPIVVVCVLAAICAVAGCATSSGHRYGSLLWPLEEGPFHVNTGVYPVSEEVAAEIMWSVMSAHYPEDTIRDSITPHRGFEVYFGLFGLPSAKERYRSDIITIQAVPTAGRASGGHRVEGHIFMLFCSADARNDEIRDLLVDVDLAAGRHGTALPHIRE